jgi:hypothetical protein
MPLFDAKLFKSCWVKSRRAASSDDDRVVLTCSKVDVFTAGLRIITTDSYMLANTFIPADGFTLDDWPDDKAPPPLSILVPDTRNLVATVLGPARKGEYTEVDVDEAGFTVRALTQGYPKLTIEAYTGGDFPSWTSFFARLEPDPAFQGVIGFNPQLLCSAAGIVGGSGKQIADAVRMLPIDHLKPVLFRRPEGHHRVILMPVRIDQGEA